MKEERKHNRKDKTMKRDLAKTLENTFFGISGQLVNYDGTYERLVKEDYKETVLKNPDKKFIFDPFVGYIAR